MKKIKLKMKNLGERSVRRPFCVNLGVYPPEKRLQIYGETSHYKYNVTKV